MAATAPLSRSPPPTPHIPQDPFDFLDPSIDTSYTPHHHHYSKHSLDFSLPPPPSSSSSSSVRSSIAGVAAVATPITITRPSPAYTSSPYVFERNPDLPVCIPAPYEELTPPPSPQSTESTVSSAGTFYSSAAHATSATTSAVGQKIAPLLNRAGSVLVTKRSSASSLRYTTPGSSRPVSPSRSSPANASAAQSPEKKTKPMAAALADMFTTKASSAPMSFGLVQTSPKKETLPAGALFGPPISASSDGLTGGSGRSSRNVSPKRPGHSRRGSTFASSAASFLGLAAPVRPVVGVRGCTEEFDEEEEDEILHMDLEKELGAHGQVRDVDTVLSNAPVLFSKMQGAYRARLQDLSQANRERDAAQEELTEQCTRAKHLKRQLGTLAERVEESEAEAASLRAELEERNNRARTIRVVEAPVEGSPGERIFSAGSIGDCCDSSSEDDGRDVGGESRPSSASSATSADANVAGMPWRSSVVPFLPPVDKVREENEALKKRVGELEEIVNGCLGLVDA